MAVHPMWRVARRWSERGHWVGWSHLEKTAEIPAAWGYGDWLNLFTG